MIHLKCLQQGLACKCLLNISGYYYYLHGDRLPTQEEILYIVAFGYIKGKRDHCVSIRHDLSEAGDMIYFYLKHIRR